jgi:UDP-glucose 4-epimerase
LHQQGAAVTVVDAMVAGCGANEHNLEEVRHKIEVVRADIGDSNEMTRILPGQEVIFNLAGEISHSRSVERPERDLDLNARSHLRFLEFCRRWAPHARIVYASSRQIYGQPAYLPVDERHPIHPVDFNGAHKKVAESYHVLFGQMYDMETVSLRLTNVYGPRQALNLTWQGFIAVFLARALSGDIINVFGTGAQSRDMIFVDDVVAAFLLAGCRVIGGPPRDQVFNIGGPKPVSLTEIAQTAAEVAGSPAGIRFVPFPEQRKRIDIGSYVADWTRFHAWTGWEPRIELREGLQRTVAFYREHASKYPIAGLDPAAGSETSPPRVLGTVAG